MKPTFTAAISGDTLELRVYGPIGAGMFMDGVTADSFDRMLEPARSGQAKRVVCRINSPGGSAYDGMAIRSMLSKLSGVEKVCEVEGLAASAGSLIAMGCDTIRMHTGAALMIHEARAILDGAKDCAALTKVIAGLETLNDGMASVYAKRTGMSKEECRALMAAETWLTPDQAVAQKFCDELVDSDDGLDVAAAWDLSAYGYANVPQQLTAARGEPTPDDAGKETDMSGEILALIAQDLGLASGAEPASVTAAVRKVMGLATELRAQCGVDSNEALLGAVRGLLEAKAQIPGLQAKVAEQATQLEAQQRAAIFAADKADPKGRKITPALEQWLSTQPLAVIEGYMANATHVVKVEQSSVQQPAVANGGADGITLAEADGVATVNGKPFEAMTGSERASLHQTNPEQYTALRDNWVGRGSPTSREQRASA